MNEQLGLLIRLQDLDTRIDLLRGKRERMPQTIEEARRPIEQAKADYEKSKNTYESLSHERRDKESELAAWEEKLEKLHHRTLEIKTNKEYQAHLAEIEAAKRGKSNLEEALLILMDQSDLIKKDVDNKKRVVAEEEGRFKIEQQRLETELVTIEEELKQLEQESKSVSAKIEDRLLREYHQLRANRKGLGVVPIKEGTCQGCRLALPPQLFADVRKNEKIITCSHCHRILYWPDPLWPVQSSA
ncbi:MAG: zinc ribbon domain-containing protein [Nitrospiria bacterium]